MSHDDAVEAATEALVPFVTGPRGSLDMARWLARRAVDAAAPHLTAEALGQVEYWERMAKRREEALDALGAERNTWARQMADLNDEREDAHRAKADAEARMRDALNERDDALNEVERLRDDVGGADLAIDLLLATDEQGLADEAALEARAEKAEAEVKRLQLRVAEYESAITWQTTCLNCSNLLDRCYEADVKREEAEAEVERLRAFVDEWGVFVLAHCEGDAHDVAINDGDGGVYVCPVCRAEQAEARIARVEALLPERDTGWSPAIEFADRIRAALRDQCTYPNCNCPGGKICGP